MYGIDTAIFAVRQHYKGYTDILQTAKKMGIKIYFSYEEKNLGTAGGIKNAYRFLKGEKDFFVLNGDILSDCNLGEMLKFHREKSACATIATVKTTNPLSFGVIDVAADQRINTFTEKPQQPVSHIINAGIYIFRPDIFDEITDKQKEISLEKDIFPSLLKKEKQIYAFLHNGYWTDIGTIETYKKANFDVIKLGFYKTSFDLGLYQNINIQGNLIAGKNVIFGDRVEVKGNVIIGEGSYIGSNTVIEDSILFKNVIIGENCHIPNSIIGNSVIIESHCIVRNSAIADSSRLCQFSKLVDIL